MKKIVSSFIMCFFTAASVACTTFCINQNGHIVFGRNYDWVTDAGFVNSNQRGLIKTSIKDADGKTISWVSKFGSITFNQYGKEFPTGGMNEKGLVVEVMWLDGSRYPEKDTRPAVNVLQWVQYQLDNCATIEELIDTDSVLRIEGSSTPLHYLVADATGKVATIEYLDGKMVVHKGNELPFPVLTNSTYAASAESTKSFLKNKEQGLPGNNSLDRFVKACRMINEINETNITIPLTAYAFSVLDAVSQGSYTVWSIVYDVSNKKILFKTVNNRDVKSINFSGFDFSCTSPSKMFDMNQDDKGDITKKFTLPDTQLKQKIIYRAFSESSKYVSTSDKQKEELLRYEMGMKCNNQ